MKKIDDFIENEYIPKYLEEFSKRIPKGVDIKAELPNILKSIIPIINAKRTKCNMKTMNDVMDEIFDYVYLDEEASENGELEIEKIISEYVNQEVKKKTEEFELRLRMQKIHCKLFHRQKISVWFMNCYYALKYFIKPIKID